MSAAQAGNVALRGNPGWKPGTSGNPSGKPKPENDIGATVIAMCRKLGPKAINKLSAMIDSEDERISLSACVYVLDRGFGKPVQAVTGDNTAASITFLHLIAARAASDAVHAAPQLEGVVSNETTREPVDLTAPALE